MLYVLVLGCCHQFGYPQCRDGEYDKHIVHAILDEALFCTVSYVNDDGTPVTIPTNFVRIGESIVVHGKASAGYIRALATGRRACLSVTLVRLCACLTLLMHSLSMYLHDTMLRPQFDALILARSAFNHSANYRSVIIYGSGEEVT